MNLRQKPSGIWVVDYVDETGKRRRESTGTRDKAEARRLAAKIIRGEQAPAENVVFLGDRGRAEPAPLRLRAPAPEPKPEPRREEPGVWTMDRLFRKCELEVWSPDQVKSQASIKSNLKILSELIGERPVTDMDHEALVELKNTMQLRGYAPGTVKRKMDMVSKALGMATEWIDPATKKPILFGKPKMPKFDVKNTRDRVLTAHEERAIFDAIEQRSVLEPHRDWPRFRALVKFLLDTGCRLGEATNAKFDDLSEIKQKDPETGEERAYTFVLFRRYKTKNDRPRRIPLTQRVVDELPMLRLISPDGRLFPMKNAKAWYMWDTIRTDLKAQRRMNLDDVVLHTLRHTCISRLADKLPIQKVSEWAGHSDISITRDVYMHLNTGSLLEGVSVLEGA